MKIVGVTILFSKTLILIFQERIYEVFFFFLGTNQLFPGVYIIMRCHCIYNNEM